MNTIREINRINDKEIELGHVGGMGPSWHDDWKDTAYIYVGGLPTELTEGDVLVIFSQFGEIVDVHMPRDKETRKPRGFGFLMYEDQRSTILAVDNMNGGKVLGRTVRVDHTRYKQQQTKDEHGDWIDPDAPSMNAMPKVIGANGDNSDSVDSEADLSDPMAAYLRDERKRERALVGGPSSKKDKDKKKETKEEKRARKAEKREKKARKEAERMQRIFEEEYKREMGEMDVDPAAGRSDRKRDGRGDRASGSRVKVEEDVPRVKVEDEGRTKDVVRNIKRERIPSPDGRNSGVSRDVRSPPPPRSMHLESRDRPSALRDDTPHSELRDHPRSDRFESRERDRSDRRSPPFRARRSPPPIERDWREARTEARQSFPDERDEDRDRRRGDYKAKHDVDRVMRQMDKRGVADRDGTHGAANGERRVDGSRLYTGRNGR